MLKKKSFITLLLVFCLIVPVMCTLVACGKKDNEDEPKAVVTTVTAEQWSKILAFDGIDNFTLRLEGSDRVLATKVTANVVSHSSNIAGGFNENIYDITNKKAYNRTSSDGKYTVMDDSTLTLTQALGYAGSPTKTYSSIVNSFDTFEYKADEKVYYAASATFDGSTKQDVKLTFNNGYLIKVEYKRATSSGSVASITTTYTYGDAIVIIPTGDQVNA